MYISDLAVNEPADQHIRVEIAAAYHEPEVCIQALEPAIDPELRNE